MLFIMIILSKMNHLDNQLMSIDKLLHLIELLNKKYKKLICRLEINKHFAFQEVKI